PAAVYLSRCKRGHPRRSVTETSRRCADAKRASDGDATRRDAQRRIQSEGLQRRVSSTRDGIHREESEGSRAPIETGENETPECRTRQRAREEHCGVEEGETRRLAQHNLPKRSA